MIKLEEELSRFATIDLTVLEKKLGGIPEDVRTAISMYNKAIGDIQNGNDDMAVIALKKSISLYPGFYEAMNLMGLCYLRSGEEVKGRDLFEQVIKMDDSSLRAMDYLDRLDGKIKDGSSESRVRSFGKNRYSKALPAWLSRGLSPEKNGPWFLKYIGGFLIGFLLMLAIWLLVPTGKPLFSVSQEQTGLMDNVQALQEENRILQETLAESQQDLEKTGRLQEKMKEEMDAYKAWVSRVAELRDMLANSEYRAVILKIEQNYQGLDIPEDIQVQMAAIYEQARPKALKFIYDEALKAYKGNVRAQDKAVFKQVMSEFDLAIGILETLEEKPSYTTDLYYYGAKAYFLAGEPNQEDAAKKAIEAFRKVVEREPKTAKGKSAASWIKEIEAGRTVKP